jgi:hypothetical protein
LQTLRNSAEEIDEYLTNKNYTTLWYWSILLKIFV